MGTLQSCRFISPAAPAPFVAAVRPPPSTSAFVPRGCRRWPSLNHGEPGAIRPCLLVVRAGKHNYGGAMPAPDELADGHYFVEERKRVMDRYNDIIHTDHGCLYMEATNMSGQLCLLANQALTLASQIMRKPEPPWRTKRNLHLRGHNPHDSPSVREDLGRRRRRRPRQEGQQEHRDVVARRSQSAGVREPHPARRRARRAQPDAPEGEPGRVRSQL